MTKARLTTWINWDSDGTGIGADLPGPNAIEMDIVVNEGDDPITIVVTDQGVSTSVRTEPTFITERGCGVFDAGIPHQSHDWTVQSHTFSCTGVPLPLIHPETTVSENVTHVLMALRNGSNMTRGNSAFMDLCRQMGIDIDSVEVI